MNNLYWGIAVLLALYLLLAVLAYLLQDRLIYFPQKNLPATPADYGLEYSDVELTAEDGVSIHGWYVPSDRSPDGNGAGRLDGPARTLLFFHGNGGNISGRLETVSLFHEMGLNVLIIDYRGYGRSRGSPSEEGTYRDAHAAWNYLVEERKASPDSVVVMGRSLGGAVAAWLGARERPLALILESTFTSAADMARHAYPIFPVDWMLRHRYPTARHIRGLSIPKLFAHSPDDRIVPYRLGRELYEGAPEPKTFLELEGGHNNAFQLTGQRYREAVRRFLTMLPAR